MSNTARLICLLFLLQCAAWPGGGLGQGDSSGGRQMAAGGGRPEGPAPGGEHTSQTHADQNIHYQSQAGSNGFRRFGRQEINMQFLFVCRSIYQIPTLPNFIIARDLFGGQIITLKVVILHHTYICTSQCSPVYPWHLAT